jgi:hypothetical protein
MRSVLRPQALWLAAALLLSACDLFQMAAPTTAVPKPVSTGAPKVLASSKPSPAPTLAPTDDAIVPAAPSPLPTASPGSGDSAAPGGDEPVEDAPPDDAAPQDDGSEAPSDAP